VDEFTASMLLVILALDQLNCTPARYDIIRNSWIYRLNWLLKLLPLICALCMYMYGDTYMDTP
jgi:hypothetical protein